MVRMALAMFTPPQILLMGGAALLYASARAVADSLSGDAASPGRDAFVQWIPIATVAIVATCLEQPAIAMSVIFVTAVAAASMAAGAAMFTAGEFDPGDRLRRLWPFVPTVALAALLIGLSGRVNWEHALFLLVIGWALLGLWRESPPDPRRSDAAPSADSASRPPPPRPIVAVRRALAIPLAMLGAWGVIRGLVGFSAGEEADSRRLLVLLIIGPLVAIPMVMSGSARARRGMASAAIASHVGVVLLNLCLLVPVVALLWYPVSRGMLRPVTYSLLLRTPPPTDTSSIGSSAASQPATAPSTGPAPTSKAAAPGTQPSAPPTMDSMTPPAGPILYPQDAWRVDTVILIVCGMLMLPAALGRWRPGTGEGMALIVVYAIYVLAAAAVAVRG